MKDVLWRTGFTLAALTVLLFLGPGVSCNLDSLLARGIRGPAPQSAVGTYLSAVAEGDRQAALDLWLAPGPDGTGLQARREEMTEALLGYGPRLEYRVVDAEYWQECCETEGIDDPRDAGAARFVVAISGEDRPESIYLFDVMASGLGSGPAPGTGAKEAAVQATGPWAIVDVYPQDGDPLAWTAR